MALVFTTDENDRDEDSGWPDYHGEVVSGKEAMRQRGIKRIRLGPKEGLAVNNGATFSAAIAALAVVDAENLLDVADAALAMSLEAVMGCRSAFDPRLHHARGHTGQMQVAEHVLALTEGSDSARRSGTHSRCLFAALRAAGERRCAGYPWICPRRDRK